MRRIVFALATLFAFLPMVQSDAAVAPIDLRTAAAYSVLGGQTVTNTGPTTLAGGLGVAPGSAFTGFPPGIAAFTHAADASADLAQTELTTAYLLAAALPATGSVSGDIVGQTFGPGVYAAPSSLFISGDVTLDGQGDPNALFVFQTGSTLITATGSRVILINGARACNVFWQVGSSATLGTYSTFVGTIMALTSITVTTGVTVEGRALARNGSTTLDSDTFRTPNCTPTPPVTTVPPTVTVSPTVTVPGTVTVPPSVTVPTVTLPGQTTTPIQSSIVTIPTAGTLPECRACAPGETAVEGTSTSIVSGGGTTSIVSSGSSTSIVSEGGTTSIVTSESTVPTVSCVPKEKKHHSPLQYAAVGTCAAIISAGCAGPCTRFLRRFRK